MKKLLLASAAIIGLIIIVSSLVPESPAQPKKLEAQYGDIIAANVPTIGCSSEAAHDKLRALAREGDAVAASKVAGCIAIAMGTTGKAIKTYGKSSICVRWQGEPDCLWSPRGDLLLIPASAK